MSLYLRTSEGEEFELATNAGWSLVGEWIDTLDLTAAPDLVQLWEHGWGEPAAAIGEQLEQALVASPPTDSQAAKTASELLETLKGLAPNEAIVVTDGTEADDTVEDD